MKMKITTDTVGGARVITKLELEAITAQETEKLQKIHDDIVERDKKA
jgi:hypothetical protein